MTEITNKTVPQKYAKIYCNKCGKFLAERPMESDGWFSNDYSVGSSIFQVRITNCDNYDIFKPACDLDLCDDCRDEFSEKLAVIKNLVKEFFKEMNSFAKEEDND